MTETLTWHELYHDALIRFHGDTPSPPLEAQLIDIFRERPAEVQAAITKVADRYAAGKVRSPWPVIKRELDRDQARHLAVAVSADRQRLIELAEHWLTTAGLYMPSDDELLDEVFGQHGRLKPWASDTELRTRILNLYREHRPRGERAEQDARDRAAAYRQQRIPTPKPEPDTDAEHAPESNDTPALTVTADQGVPL